MEGLYQGSSKSCPGSPAEPASSASFASQPSSPAGGVGAWARNNPSSLLKKAHEKLDKKFNKKQEMKLQKRSMISDKLESGMSRAQVLEDVILLDSNQKNGKKVKKLKHLIRDCDQGAKARKEMRIAEYQEKRGFRRFQQTGFQNGKVPEDGGGMSSKKQKKREKLLQSLEPQNKNSKKDKSITTQYSKITRAALIPSGIQAACKFLKKETQKVNSNSSEMGKRLVKDLKQEIFGMKHGLHAAAMLKKVERKRLADMVINLRNHA